MERLKSWFKIWMPRPSSSEKGFVSPSERIAELEAHCADLTERLRWTDEKLRERSELLYTLQQQYSTEHFSLYESTRDLKAERMRNAGAYAGLDTILSRARELQSRIRDLKGRLRRHEAVEDRHFDDAPILIEDQPTLKDYDDRP
jgi:chromosome segregation ATPase